MASCSEEIAGNNQLNGINGDNENVNNERKSAKRQRMAIMVIGENGVSKESVMKMSAKIIYPSASKKAKANGIIEAQPK
jgi:ABC-type antimicrobial peptide transport system ATPase subunit